MSPLALAILPLVTVWQSPLGCPIYARHIDRLGGESYVEAVADEITTASELTGVRPSLHAALLVSESSLDPSAESPVGAYGLGQLHGANLSEWRAACRLEPSGCFSAHVLISSRVLARFVELCGSEERGVSAYQGRGCVRSRRARHVLAVARGIEGATK